MSASAPHAEDGATVYPGTCRGRYDSVAEARARGGREPAVRFAVPPGVVGFEDQFAGGQSIDVAARLGDFVVAKSQGADANGSTRWAPAYQLAVVVDDAAMGVTDVVRGDDLLESTPRQILIYRALGLAERAPRYYHLPLVVGPDGRRLAKRHGDTRLSWYRGRSVPPARMLALLAKWCGIGDAAPTDTAAGVLDWMLRRFRIEAMPRAATTFSSEDDAWLGAA